LRKLVLAVFRLGEVDRAVPCSLLKSGGQAAH